MYENLFYLYYNVRVPSKKIFFCKQKRLFILLTLTSYYCAALSVCVGASHSPVRFVASVPACVRFSVAFADDEAVFAAVVFCVWLCVVACICVVVSSSVAVVSSCVWVCVSVLVCFVVTPDRIILI